MYRIVLFPRKIFRIINVSAFKTRSKLSTLVFNNLIPRSLSRSNRDLIDKNIALLSIEKPLTPPSNELWIYAEKLLELNLRKSSDICQRKCIPVKNYSHRIFSEYISSIKTDRIIKLNFFFFHFFFFRKLHHCVGYTGTNKTYFNIKNKFRVFHKIYICCFSNWR